MIDEQVESTTTLTQEEITEVNLQSGRILPSRVAPQDKGK